jgi:hypothetical protein
MKAYLLGGAFLFCLATGAQAQNCQVPYFSGVDNQSTVGHMIVRSGRLCGVARLNSSAAIFNTRIVSPPRFGRAGVAGASVRYMSRPGYVGPDAFVFQNQGRDRWGQPMFRTVQVQVNVVP